MGIFMRCTEPTHRSQSLLSHLPYNFATFPSGASIRARPLRGFRQELVLAATRTSAFFYCRRC